MQPMTQATELIARLNLAPHPEGGWYREIYRSATRVETARGSRSALTTIYYLLEQEQLSRWHVVQADEIWHFYAGAPLELVAYAPDTRSFERHVLGDVGGAAAAENDVADNGLGAASGGAVAAGGLAATPWVESVASAASVAVIPTGVWQAARSLGEYSLVGCTVGPGFEFADFQFVSALPSHADHFSGDLARFASLL